MQKPCQLRCGGNGRLCKQAPNPRLARARKSTPYTARPRRFFMGLQTNNDIVTIAERMLTINDLLQALEPLHKRLAGLEQGRDVVEKGLNRLAGKMDGAEKNRSEKIETVDRKVEAVHTYQQKAHTEIMDRLFESNEANGQEQQRLEKRIERIEKHLGLPPLK